MTTPITLHEINGNLVAFGEDAKVLAQQADIDFMMTCMRDEVRRSTVIRKGVRSEEKLQFPAMIFCIAPCDFTAPAEERHRKTLSALDEAGVAYNLATTRKGETP